MSNGDAYFISDNDRMRQKTRKVQSIGHSVPYSTGDAYHPSSESRVATDQRITIIMTTTGIQHLIMETHILTLVEVSTK